MRTEPRGRKLKNLYNGERKGRSCSSAPATHIARASLSNVVIFIVRALAISSVHFANHPALLCEMPSLWLLWMSSKPSQETRSLPAVFDHEGETPAVAQRTKKAISAERYSGPVASR